eukprot:TRINITY_DN9551_c0_g1_i5.p1 TRINITY_DN9551_c0_g1~~TRINITY_DN9551_c0_g1_i5.p1  ORF type:complete len:215 (-),score=26.18 TRINITY_DN9551_c0_g1_i5:115-759(-)
MRNTVLLLSLVLWSSYAINYYPNYTQNDTIWSEETCTVIQQGRGRAAQWDSIAINGDPKIFGSIVVSLSNYLAAIGEPCGSEDVCQPDHFAKWITRNYYYNTMTGEFRYNFFQYIGLRFVDQITSTTSVDDYFEDDYVVLVIGAPEPDSPQRAFLLTGASSSNEFEVLDPLGEVNSLMVYNFERALVFKSESKRSIIRALMFQTLAAQQRTIRI